MGPADEVDPEGLLETANHVVAEHVRDPAEVRLPASHAAVGVGPEDVADEALVGDVRGALHVADLVEVFEVRRCHSAFTILC